MNFFRSRGRCWPSASIVIMKRPPWSLTYRRAVRIASPFPQFFACRSTVMPLPDNSSSTSASVLPSSTTTTCGIRERHSTAMDATVSLLLYTGIAHQIWSSANTATRFHAAYVFLAPSSFSVAPYSREIPHAQSDEETADRCPDDRGGRRNFSRPQIHLSMSLPATLYRYPEQCSRPAPAGRAHRTAILRVSPSWQEGCPEECAHPYR